MILGFLMGTLTGGILAIPLLRWGARLDRSRLSAFLVRLAMVAVVPAAVVAVPVVLRGYPFPYARILLGFPLAATVLLIPFVLREKPRDWSQLPHAAAGLLTASILGSELFLGLAAAGLFPAAHFPAASYYVAGPRAAAALAGSLRDGDPAVRKAAAKLLVNCGAAGVEPLQAAAADPDARVRGEGISGLSGLRSYPHPRTAEIMLAALQDRTSTPRVYARSYFTQNYDPRIVSPLLASVLTMPAETELMSIQSMVASLSPTITPQLAEQMRSNDVDVRRTVMLSLTQADNAETVPILEAGLRDPVPAVRALAAEALGRISRQASTNRAMIVQSIYSGKTVRVWGDEAKRPPDINRAIRLLTGALRDPELEVRLGAAKALALATENEFNVNGGQITTDRELGMFATDREPVVLPLLACLKESHSDLRLSALTALAQCASPRAVPGLTAALAAAKDAETRKGLIKALGATGSPQAVPVIRKFGKDLHELRHCDVCQAFYNLEAYDEVQHHVYEDTQ